MRIAREALRARVTLGLAALALLASAGTLAKDVAPAKTVGLVLWFVAVLVALAQLLTRSYLMQLDQEDIVEKTGEAAKKLQLIQQTTEEELRTERKQNKQLELLFTAMKELNLIEVESLEALQDGWPTTLFYLQRHGAAISDVLGGRWDRSEYLRPSQLWREYGELVTRMRRDETFRSTVCVPSEPSRLFQDEMFNRYVAAIYEAARTQGVFVKRLLVLDGEEWPPNKDDLEDEVLEHLRKLGEVDDLVSTLKARVTIDEIARESFHDHPDFMVWGDGLLIQSDLKGVGGLVTQAEFYFASKSWTEEIIKRQGQFDELFGDAKRALPLSEFV